MIIGTDDPVAVAVVEAIRSGDVDRLQRLLADNPGLAGAALGSGPDAGGDTGMTRSLLHVATDWPGHFPNGPAVVATLVAAGADPDARFTGPHTETPLHWAASSDDVAVLDALLDAGADIDAPGAVIGGGTPLADATAFGQWQAARTLVERGARVDFWQAATLGLTDIVEGAFAGEDPPSADQVTEAFWGACHGGQRQTAEYLLDRGADIGWVGWDDLTPLEAARREGHADLADSLAQRGPRTVP